MHTRTEREKSQAVSRSFPDSIPTLSNGVGTLNSSAATIADGVELLDNTLKTSFTDQEKAAMQTQASSAVDAQAETIKNRASAAVDSQAEAIKSQASAVVDSRADEIKSQAEDAVDGRADAIRSQATQMVDGKADDIKNQAILDRLKGVPKEQRTARFVCAIAAVLPDGEDTCDAGDDRRIYRGMSGRGEWIWI